MSFDIARLLHHTRVLAEQFPHRHAGEPDQEKAARYIADELRAAGLATQELAAPILGWEINDGPLLEVLAPEPAVLECAPYVYSGSTAPEGFSGKLVRAGESYAGGPTPWPKYALAGEDGQWGVLLVGRPDGPAMGRRGTPSGSVSVADGPSFSWPSCIVGQEAVAAFEGWLSAGIPVRLHYAAQTRHKPGCRSVMVKADLPGHTFPDEVVVFGVHHDAAGAIGYPPALDSAGANDNASGVAIMLEYARCLARQGSPRTVWFCSFDGEERNLMGSSDFVRTLAETRQLDQVVAYVGIDQAAYGDRFWVLASDDAPHLQPRLNLRQLAQAVIETLDLQSLAGTAEATPLHAGSDHWPFYYAGVPAILTGWHPFEGYHRGDDRFERCTNDEQFMLTAQVTFELLLTVLQQPAQGAVRRPLSAGHVLTPPPAIQ